MIETPGSVQIQQLLELLAVVSSYSDQESAIQGAVERAAQALEAEVAAVIVDGQVHGCVGFPIGRVPNDDLLAVARKERDWVEVPGAGTCHAMAAGWVGAHPGQLVLARWGENFTVEERSVVRGMARLLELTLTMLRTLQAERQRQQLLEDLFTIQRAISRRQPLDQILCGVTSAAQDLFGDEIVGLWLRDDVVDRYGISSALLAERTDDRLGTLISAPVHDSGTVAGNLRVGSSRPDRTYTDADLQMLQAFAEHVSLALTDANTVDRMHQAFHDSLTGLASRRLFLDHLNQQLRTADPFALLYLDLDQFKAINDTLGHTAGDTLLVTAAQRLKSQLRDTDVAARLGGDEFAALLKGVSTSDDGIRVAERILRALDQPLAVAGQELPIRASIGIALRSPDVPEPAELIRRADIAMYHAKRNGRGRYAVFTDDMLLTPS